MKSLKHKKLYKLFFLLSKKRKKQFYFLILLIFINGISESLSISTIIPFLTIIVSKKEVFDLNSISKYVPFNIYSSSQLLFIITVLFCFFIVLSTFLRIFNNWYIFRLTANIDIELSNLIFKKNIYQSYTDYTRKSSSKILSMINEKVAACSSALNSLFTILLSSIIGASIITSLLFFNWKIVFVSFAFLYIYYLLISKKVKKELLRNGKILALNDPLRIRTIQESFNGFRDIVINGTQNIYYKLFDKYNSIIKLKNAKSQFYILSPKFFIEGISLLILASAGCFLTITNYENANFIPLIGSFVYSLQRLLPLIQQAYAAWASYKVKSPSINDVLNEIKKDEDNDSYKKNQIIKFDRQIELKNIYYSYNQANSVLKDINVEIQKGEHIGLYGVTGSGKSTFLDVLMGLLPPNKGEILVDGKDIYENKKQYSWTSKISHVPQSIFLKEGTIAENIAFCESIEKINQNLLEKASRIAQIYDFIDKTEDGFNTMVGERGIRLSGGQRQRIAIARAIYQGREILILDEATSALDESTEKNIINSILQTYKGLTIIMVTHRLKSLENCHRVFRVTSKGEIEEA